MANILVVDDEADLRQLVKTALERDGHRVAVLASGGEVDENRCAWADCILLDAMMPGEDGFATCARVRELADCPIVFLTAKVGEEDVVRGLALGGDDYLLKPFRLAELRARVNAHLRRQGRAPARRLVRGAFQFDLAGRALYAGGQALPLTRGEYSLCELLAVRPGQVFSREQLYEAAFGYESEADPAAVTEHIKNIRAKLRPFGQPVETVWGVGYKWKSEG